MFNNNLNLKTKTLTTLAFSSMLLFTGCGSSDSTTPPDDTTQQAQLIDSEIAGVEYTTNSGISGVTDENGYFSYNPTDTKITFKLGALTLSDFNLSKLNSDDKILPADLVGVDRNDTTNPDLLKLLTVFQSLDDDGNASNGILITQNTKNNITLSSNLYDINTTQLDTVIQNTGKSVKTILEVREHYKSTLSTTFAITPEFAPFITVWETTQNDENITIPINSAYDYNYTVSWGDGTISKDINYSITHTYSIDGNHTVSITGTFPTIYFNNTGSELLINNISSWGDISWKNFNRSFYGCSNLESNATDTPNLSDLNSTAYMFAKATKFNNNINGWDTSNITDMDHMFYNATSFNQPLNDWNTSNVTNMHSMFFNATNFNQPLNNWNTSSVTDMYRMFYGATSFNQPLNDWDTSNVIKMTGMFNGASNFNQPLNDWNTSNVIYIDGIFYEATSFNQDISSWDMSNVTEMSSMFYNATSFNQDISSWDVSNVTNMYYMFNSASAFSDQNLSDWNVSKVTNHGDFMTNSGAGNTEPNWP